VCSEESGNGVEDRVFDPFIRAPFPFTGSDHIPECNMVPAKPRSAVRVREMAVDREECFDYFPEVVLGIAVILGMPE
jgi:hypothetical protein